MAAQQHDVALCILYQLHVLNCEPHTHKRTHKEIKKKSVDCLVVVSNNRITVQKGFADIKGAERGAYYYTVVLMPQRPRDTAIH